MKHVNKDLLGDLLELNKSPYNHCVTVLVSLMSAQQRRNFTIFIAEQVLPIFENKYPNDDRPRKAIKAAKKMSKLDSKENRRSVTRAASEAYDAAKSAEDLADDAASFAAYASAEAAYAATSDRDLLKGFVHTSSNEAKAAAAYAADAVGTNPDAKLKMQEQLIREAARLLNEAA